MTGVALTPRALLAARVDLSGIVPDRLAGLSAREVGGLRVPVGGRSERLGELFAVAEAADGRLEIRVGDPRLDGVGAGMRAGEIVVEGPCGAQAGAGMAGGVLTIRGDCGDLLAAALSGGTVRIGGSAGDRIGAALPGERRGMTAGSVFVSGDAGERVGERMRGGLIVVDGAAGPAGAAAMIAGTIAVGGAVGAGAGFGMRRGTLLLRERPAELPAGFVDAGVHELIYLAWLRRHFAAGPDWLGGLGSGALSARRLVGDRLAGGQGEMLVVQG